ncbi:hypothetical protein Tco_0936730 [Tanacetum coccineum]|uniref:Uncharacterized protein n=1 Tax=Tanacetum coccineum TaxID=301880 RepID=A0ABQ5DD40_9ASTR
MLLKFFGSRTHNVPPKPVPDPTFKQVVVAQNPLIMKIIHAGGIVERYYMALPAACIINKYPNYVLARPEIFRLPWDPIIRPDEILVPGEKYFVVPIPTVKKLRRRTRKPSLDMSSSLISQDYKDISSSSKSLSICKVKPVSTRRVHFKGMEGKIRNDLGGMEDKMKKKKSSNSKGSRKKNVCFSSSLPMIEETECSDKD